MQLLSTFFENWYVKISLALILCLVLTFSDKLIILHSKYMMILLFLLLFLLIISNEDKGIVILFMALCILSANINVHR